LKLPNKCAAYTLIEILIALVIFAIISMVTSTVLYNSFTTRERLGTQAQLLGKLQLTYHSFMKDIEQITNRPTYAKERKLIPSFIGEKEYIEFTRRGVVNPGMIEHRSTLERVAYVCQSHKLLRRSWERLDGVNHNEFMDYPIMSDLTKCAFFFLGKNNQVLQDWRGAALPQSNSIDSLPIAVRMDLTIKNKGEFSILAIIPEGLYG
jgi:general secretion pathway protein J